MHFAQTIGVFARLRLNHQGGPFRIGGQNRFNRSRCSARRFLRDIADACAARHIQPPLIGIKAADQHLHQRGFARAIAPDQPNTAVRRQGSRGAIDNCAPAKAHGDAVKVEHDARPLHHIPLMRDAVFTWI